MEVIPALDLTAGSVVRLTRGDLTEPTRYSTDPLAVARGWIEAGARRLHLVDLDGARDGRPVQAELVGRIVAASGVPCQVAGGLRDEAAVEEMLAAGAARCVLATALLRDPSLGARLVDRFGSRSIVAALDVRAGDALGDAWVPGATRRPAADAARALADAGISIFLVTSVERDGTLTGPDLDLLASVRRAVGPATLIASGGVSSAEDVSALRDAGAEAVILGRALYEGRLTLPEAIAAAA